MMFAPFPIPFMCGCGRPADPEFDMCDVCWLRVRDLVETAAEHVIAAAESLLGETT